MYSPAAIELFAGGQGAVRPEQPAQPRGAGPRRTPIDADLRRPQARPVLAAGGFSFAHDDGDFTKAVHRCVGVGKCRADNSAAGGFMCPSYLASKDEKDVTRGRARVLQELTNGTMIPDWSLHRGARVTRPLPVLQGLFQRLPGGGRHGAVQVGGAVPQLPAALRPISHYSIGWLPRWIPAARPAPPVGPRRSTGALAIEPLVAALLGPAASTRGGRAPAFAPVTFHRWYRTNSARRTTPPTPRRNPVVLWADSFTDGMNPEVARAAVPVLQDAGYRVDRPRPGGLLRPDLDHHRPARRRPTRLAGCWTSRTVCGAGHPDRRAGTVLYCGAALGPGRPAARRPAVGGRRRRADVGRAADASDGREAWQAPDLTGVELDRAAALPPALGDGVRHRPAAAQPSRAPALQRLAGCCGLAGNFGMERGHYEMSVAVAENALLPALREARRASVVLADGFSCRTQIEQLAGLPTLTLAELLANHIAGS